MNVEKHEYLIMSCMKRYLMDKLETYIEIGNKQYNFNEQIRVKTAVKT